MVPSSKAAGWPPAMAGFESQLSLAVAAARATAALQTPASVSTVTLAAQIGLGGDRSVLAARASSGTAGGGSPQATGPASLPSPVASTPPWKRLGRTQMVMTREYFRLGSGKLSLPGTVARSWQSR